MPRSESQTATNFHLTHVTNIKEAAQASTRVGINTWRQAIPLAASTVTTSSQCAPCAQNKQPPATHNAHNDTRTSPAPNNSTTAAAADACCTTGAQRSSRHNHKQPLHETGAIRRLHLEHKETQPHTAYLHTQ